MATDAEKAALKAKEDKEQQDYKNPNNTMRYPSNLGIDSGEPGGSKVGGTGPFITFTPYKYKLPSGKLEKAEADRVQAGASVQMYMPNNVSEAFGGQWGYESALNFNQAGGQIAADLLAGAGKAMATSQGGTKLMATATGNFGATIIPSEFLIFQKPNPYNLNLQFSFVPRNAGEASQINLICTTFKQLVLPTIDAGGGADVVLTFPAIWDIQFSRITGPGAANGLTSDRYINMACTSATINYGGGANSALVFGDTMPVQCSLSLQFQSIQYAMRART